ncbi:LOW QUALITY PROTEIN: uncharacterized protein LOC108098137 [Drosophila ficusphila]|uniref:LOW QUALITY PROTEIN: uncharacterized protein LOC108098137 n=1 Tax=Drosophila ficusphila TaxID=30025 RepID=UPI0007E5F3C1|nr:LOW QUALITY PROTEIN: uncharacterized protein LOC108098137 [Drosophila ficusphila]
MKHLMEDPLVLAELRALSEKQDFVEDEQQDVKNPPEKSAPIEEFPDSGAQDKDSLCQLACNLHKLAKDDHIVIDRKRNQVIRTDAVTQQMTIYRCLDPVGMGMRPPTLLNAQNPPPKVGRPLKRVSLSNATASAAKKPPPLEEKPALDIHRTRSGRQVRGSMPQPAPVINGHPVEPSSAEMLDMLVADLRDKDYRAPMPAPKSISNSQEVATTPTPRAVPKDSVCPGCGKIFLGRRLQRHFVKFPEHMPRPGEQPSASSSSGAAHPSTPSLFGLLTAQLQRHSHLSEEQRSDLFLNELNDFVEQLQLRSQRLIRNTSGLHFVNARTARVLGIPEGQYALDMSAMESPQAPTPEPEAAALVAGGGGDGAVAHNLGVYAELSMSLDDPLTDEAAQRLNLSAGGQLHPPSEESLLRNVSDLMQPPVAAAPPTVNHGYDHASDNAVEALTMKETPNTEAILDLKVDFFQFNPN